MSARHPRIWVLLGHRRGDNNQLLALTEGLGLPFETRGLAYRKLWPLLLKLFPTRALLLTGDTRRELQAPWPDLVIGIGRRSVAISRWIRDASGGRTKIVRLGNPRAEPKLFDLVITTPQYPVSGEANVLTLPVSMGRYRKAPKQTSEEADWLQSLPRPHLLASVGGQTRYWVQPTEMLTNAVKRLATKAQAAGGSLIVATSPRTPPHTVSAIANCGAFCEIVADGRIRYPVLLADADEHYVTADSVSMISEAVLTGKPVGLIPVDLDEEGQRALGENGFSASKRDIRRFWTELQSKGLVGTVDEPKAGAVDDPVETAVHAVKALLGNLVE
jgi:mitochondrial fission protein ELM1